MKFNLLLKVCVLLLLTTIPEYSTAQVQNSPGTVEQTEKKLAKQAKERRKKDKKANKIAQKTIGASNPKEPEKQ